MCCTPSKKSILVLCEEAGLEVRDAARRVHGVSTSAKTKDAQRSGPAQSSSARRFTTSTPISRGMVAPTTTLNGSDAGPIQSLTKAKTPHPSGSNQNSWKSSWPLTRHAKTGRKAIPNSFRKQETQKGAPDLTHYQLGEIPNFSRLSIGFLEMTASQAHLRSTRREQKARETAGDSSGEWCQCEAKTSKSKTPLTQHRTLPSRGSMGVFGPYGDRGLDMANAVDGGEWSPPSCEDPLSIVDARDSSWPLSQQRPTGSHFFGHRDSVVRERKLRRTKAAFQDMSTEYNKDELAKVDSSQEDSEDTADILDVRGHHVRRRRSTRQNNSFIAPST